MAQDKTYIAIDLKSFYASQECVERGLDPMTVNLVVADASRTEKTICLAVSPALKAFGIPGRARLFEVLQKVQAINAQRRDNAPGHTLTGSSCNTVELRENPALALDFIIAPPQMARYMECSAKIYEIYLQYVAPEDIHVYSIDEVFLDATPYLQLYGLDGRSFAKQLIQAVFDATGITATAGIGTNLYLSKIAMDIMAKRIPPDEDGVRIAELDEMSYRRELWSHRPLTDFWRVGHGYAKKLETCGLSIDLGDVRESARVYINNVYIGCAWAVPFVLDCKGALKKGKNTVRIEVTNLPANRIADLDRKGVKWRKMKEINVVDINYKRTTYADWKPMESGIVNVKLKN